MRVMTSMYLLCTDVGPLCPVDLARTQQCPRLEVEPTVANGPTTIGGPPAGDSKRVLRQVERNLVVVTHTIPMDEIKDLPLSMQPHVVGVPWTWVHIFWHLANCIIHYSRANRPRA
jgi:hypothetical protein